MILLLVLAADAVSAAIARRQPGRLVLAAVWVGLAFQAKMIEAWLVLPAFGLVYLVAAPGPAARGTSASWPWRARSTGLVSLSWMTVVSLVPAAHRPYIDGSHDNSAYEQVFVYNGFGRFGEQTPLQLLAGQSPGHRPRGGLRNPAPAPDRLLRGDLGRDTGWLLPAALIVAGWGIVSRRRQPRGDPLRACFVLWGGWLVLLAVTFSLTTTINPYYTAALTPAVAAILGAGVAAAWSRDRSAAGRPGAAWAWSSPRPRPTPPGSRRTARHPAGWSRRSSPSATAVGVASWSRWSGGPACWPSPWPRAGRGRGGPRRGLGRSGARQGAFDTPFEPARRPRP